MTGIRTDHRAIGVAGVVGVVVMGLLVLAISVIPFGKNSYSAMVQHSAGLRVGEEVQIAGVGVGKVRGISLDGHHVKVDFTVKKSVRLGSRTTAAIKVATLLGTHYLEVKPAGQGSLPHDSIPLAQTSVPYNLQDVIEGSTQALNQLDGAKINQSMQVLADTLRGTPEEARQAIDGVSRLSDIAAKRSDQMRELLASTSKVTGDLAANSAQIIDLMKQSTLVLNELTSRRRVIDEMLVDSRKLATEISGVLKDNDAELDPLMRNFTVTLNILKTQKKNLTASIDGLSTMATYFANATGNGPWVDLHVPVALGDNITCGAPNSGCQR
jgi:phospholipid/cholesterol/gamma-HCH transport system substrate-binding protein